MQAAEAQGHITQYSIADLHFLLCKTVNEILYIIICHNYNESLGKWYAGSYVQLKLEVNIILTA